MINFSRINKIELFAHKDNDGAFRIHSLDCDVEMSRDFELEAELKPYIANCESCQASNMTVIDDLISQFRNNLLRDYPNEFVQIDCLVEER